MSLLEKRAGDSDLIRELKYTLKYAHTLAPHRFEVLVRRVMDLECAKRLAVECLQSQRDYAMSSGDSMIDIGYFDETLTKVRAFEQRSNV